MLSNYFVTADIKFYFVILIWQKKNLNFLSNGNIIFFCHLLMMKLLFRKENKKGKMIYCIEKHPESIDWNE